MPAQKPQWFFQPRSHRNGAGTGDGDTAAGLTTLPTALLRRHGARARAGEGRHGARLPASAVDGVPRQDLAGLGRRAAGHTEGRGDQRRPGRCRHAADPSAAVGAAAPARRRTGPQAGQLPRVAILAPDRDSAIPVVVDAWVAVQALRAAVTPPGHGKPADSPLDQTDIEQIALEHLLVGSAIDGSPIGHSGGGLTGGTNTAEASPGQAAPTRTYTAAATRAARSRSCSTRRIAGRRPSARTTTDGGP